MSEAALSVAMQSSGSDEVAKSLSTIGDRGTGLASTLVGNKMAIRELTMGMMQLGMSALMVGTMLKESNNQLERNIGNYITLAGGLMSAVGAAFQLVRAITLITDALKKMIATEVLKQAFSGPMGWATLGIGAAVAAGAIVGVSRYESTTHTVQHNVNVKMGSKTVGQVAF